MISDAVLDLAVARGIVSAEQAKALQSLAAQDPDLAQAVKVEVGADDEALRFVSGFADVFVSLGLVLFFGSVAYFIRVSVGTTSMWGGLAALAWLVAEFFSRKRRQALPSIILLALFAVSTFMAVSGLVAQLNPTAPLNWWHPADKQGWMLAHAPSMAAAGLATAALTGLHYWRFRVPITIAAMTAALVATAVGLGFWFMPDMTSFTFNALLLVFGLLTFALAMWFDMRDLSRVTRRTDIAFWLHLLAAPLIVHPLITSVGYSHAGLTSHTAMKILFIFFGFGLVSLVIDRRALLVSGLTYAGIAFGTLLDKSGVADNTPAATLLALGLFILLLSALWHRLRQVLLRFLPPALVARLPHSHV